MTISLNQQQLDMLIQKFEEIKKIHQVIADELKRMNDATIKTTDTGPR